MAVRVTFTLDPEPDEVDDSDATGLTSEAYDDLTEKILMDLGGQNVVVEKV